MAAERGCRVVVAEVPFPIAGPEAVLEAVLARVTDRTRLAVIDHVTSQTALVFPIAELVRELEARGVDVLVDGAHAPGMVDVDIGALAPAYYAANCHKWICAPKGVGFLWVREDRRRDVRPAVISHGANAPVPPEQRYGIEFAWTGTDDSRPRSRVPAALRFLEGLAAGRRRRAARAQSRARARGPPDRRRCAGRPLPCPDAMIGAMASLPVPALPGLPRPEGDVRARPRPAPRRAVPRPRASRCPCSPARRIRSGCCGSPRRRTTRSATTSGSPRRCALTALQPRLPGYRGDAQGCASRSARPESYPPTWYISIFARGAT